MDPNTVQWNTLQHAHGPASDIPTLLEAAAAGKAAAVEKLADRLAHQGWLSPEVALAAVPFLFQLAETARGTVKAATIRLLADLACAGSHEHLLAGEASDAAFILDSPEIAAVREAVLERSADAEQWLKDRSAAVRGASALLLAVARRSAAPLEAALAVEKNTAARVDALIALGHCRLDSSAALPDSIVAALGSKEESIAVAGAIAAAHRGPIDERVEEALLSGLNLPPVKGSAWAKSAIRDVTVEALRLCATRDDRSDLLQKGLARADNQAHTKITTALIKRAFAREIASLGPSWRPVPREAPPPLESLAPAQRSLLEMLAADDGGWGGDGRFWLEQLAFPRCPPALRLYLGYSAPTDLLDRLRFEHAGQAGTLRELITVFCGGDDPHEAVAFAKALLPSIGDDQLIEVLELAFQVETGTIYSKYAFILHSLVGKGPLVAPQVRGRIEHMERVGPPSWWNARCSRLLGSNLPYLYWVALKQIEPSTEVPRDLFFKSGAADWWVRPRERLEKLMGADAALWIQQAFEDLPRPSHWSR